MSEPKVFRIKSTGKIAAELLSPDYGVIEYDIETPVIVVGEEVFQGIKHEDLEEYTPQGDELLTAEWIKNTCKPGQGEATCCFLVFDKAFRCARVCGRQGLMHAVQESHHNAKSKNCPGKFGSLDASVLAEVLKK